MTQEKKMYVVFCEDSEKYWCSYNTWSDQLRKATIFHSTKYANEVHKRFKELRLKNVEVRMGVVSEKPTNADRVRAMNAEQLAEWALFRAPQIGREYSHSLIGLITWLQQPAEETER